jgi:hypothetical protein
VSSCVKQQQSLGARVLSVQCLGLPRIPLAFGSEGGREGLST